MDQKDIGGEVSDLLNTAKINLEQAFSAECKEPPPVKDQKTDFTGTDLHNLTVDRR